MTFAFNDVVTEHRLIGPNGQDYAAQARKRVL